MPKLMRALIAAAPLLLVSVIATEPAEAADHASIFTYHRFGEVTLPSTNVRLDQFREQMRNLATSDHTVLPLPEIVDAILDGKSLPDKTVAITIDDAYLSAYRNARPILREAGFPWTLFVATKPVDDGLSGYMSWDQIRQLAEGVTIGSQTASHPHMADAGFDAALGELQQSNDRFMAELGKRPDLFSYPYGEASLEVRRAVVEAGFRAAFGQHSGVMNPGDDRYYFPRFAINERYGGIKRFRMLSDALPLRVSDVSPPDMMVTPETNPPNFGFTIDPEVKNLDRLACYGGSQGRLELQRLGDTRIEVRMGKALPAGRERVNCTLPGPDGRWRWFGRQFYTRHG